MASAVIYPDLELYLTTWYREQLGLRSEAYCSSFTVDNKEPDPSKQFPSRLLVVRSDGLVRTSFATATVSIGLSVLAGSKLKPKDAIDAALMVMALAERLPTTGTGSLYNPIARVTSSAGPFTADESQERARRYVTLELALAGQPF